MAADFANELDVRPQALTVPDIDTDIGLMHTFFTLEDLRGLTVGELDGEVCLRLDKSSKSYMGMSEMLHAWLEQAKKLEAGEITKEEYDRWRYNYPKYDTYQRWAKVPSQELTDWQQAYTRKPPAALIISAQMLLLSNCYQKAKRNPGNLLK